MKNVLFSLFLSFVCLSANAQILKITDVFSRQLGKDKIEIKFKLDPLDKSERFDVNIYCSTDGGETYGTSLKELYYFGYEQEAKGMKDSKDEYKLKKFPTLLHGGSYKVQWHVLKERLNGLNSRRVVFEIRANRTIIGRKTNDLLLPRMVFVKGGEYEIKDQNDELKKYKVKDFYISRYDITNAEYNLYISVNGGKPSRYAGNSPVQRMRKADAIGYCRWRRGRLPKLKEWYWAARGGRKSKGYIYSGSNVLEEVIPKNGEAAEVGQMFPNELGIYGMSRSMYRFLKEHNYTYINKSSRADKIDTKYDMNGNRLDKAFRLVRSPPKRKDRYKALEAGTMQWNGKPHKLKKMSISTQEITNEAYAQFLNFEFASYKSSVRVKKWIKLHEQVDGKKCHINYKHGTYSVERGYEDKPVNFVSHLGALVYARWRGGRLPTELELRYARKQGLTQSKIDKLWCKDSYSKDIVGKDYTSTSTKYKVLDTQGKKLGYYNYSYFPDVGFRVVIPNE